MSGQYITQVPHDLHLDNSVIALYDNLDNSLIFFCNLGEAVFIIKNNKLLFKKSLKKKNCGFFTNVLRDINTQFL
ncbi:hypothetical protein ES703_114706 [subsurface metagenome]